MLEVTAAKRANARAAWAAVTSYLDAMWNDMAEPRAAYCNGKTYLAWVGSDGHVRVAQYVHSTNALSTPVDLITTTSTDGIIHNSPAVCVRSSDRKIVVAVCQNKSTGDTPRVYISTNAEDASAFGVAVNVGSAVTSPTYPSLTEMGSDLYCWFRRYDAPTFHTGFHKSTDGGATWGGWTPILSPVTTNAQYHRIGTNGNRVDIFTTDTDRSAGNESAVYHMYLAGTTLYKSDGATIGAVGSGPYAANTGTLVQSNSLGAARAAGWSYDGSGNPCALILVNSGGTTTLARHARWTGSAWSVNAIADAGGIIGGNVYIGSGAMAKADPWTVYLSKKIGDHFEMWRYVSADSGATWTGIALTAGTQCEDHAMPDTPFNAASGLVALWALGRYASDTSYRFELVRSPA